MPDRNRPEDTVTFLEECSRLELLNASRIAAIQEIISTARDSRESFFANLKVIESKTPSRRNTPDGAIAMLKSFVEQGMVDDDLIERLKAITSVVDESRESIFDFAQPDSFLEA